MKLVGGDSGRYERETFVEEVLLAPSERAVVDVLFDTPGEVRLEHRTPDHVYHLGAFAVAGIAAGGAATSFEVLRVDPELTAEHRAIGGDLERPPDKVLAFFSRMPLLYGADDTTASAYVCPMHPEVTSAEPGTCPKCGMKLVAAQVETVTSSTYVCPMHPDVTGAEPRTCPTCGMKLVRSEGPPMLTTEPGEPHERSGKEHGEHEHVDGLEWEDLMPEVNRASDSSNMIWQLIDRETGAENGAIAWAFTVGDRVKIRLVNEMDLDHPMHHPFHIHGAGRFLILSRDGQPEANLVWKDTVLVRAGETVDILLDVSNPGLWMAHCHIAEHNQAGMMFSFDVARRPEEAAT
jgi:FtsP/CotA-like multicopper oxidase with cupredoxin domain